MKLSFSNRLLQSLSSCPTCIIIDDHLRVVQHSTHVAEITRLEFKVSTTVESKESQQLSALKKKMKNEPPMGQLVSLCKTLDQVRSKAEIHYVF